MEKVVLRCKSERRGETESCIWNRNPWKNSERDLCVHPGRQVKNETGKRGSKGYK